MNGSMAIELSDVCKSFGKTTVLKGVSLAVEPGKTYAFLGRNGAGKTTTIRLMLGLLKRDSGSMHLLGLDPSTDALALRDRIGYLAEDQTMYGWMRVDEIVRFVAPFYSNWDHQLAEKYLREFDLPLGMKIKNLSKGQNVRLGLVLALSHRPELVVLDDPALGLDPIMRKQFNRDLITHLQGEGRTVFYSSHLLYEVEPVADVVAILDQGQVVRQEETEQLRDDVKQIIVPQHAVSIASEAAKVLDRRSDGDEVAFVLAGVTNAIDALGREGVPYRTVDLNLDEIFEAYVTGNPGSNNEQREPVLA